MFGCYRKGDANDPDTYTAAVAAVLSEYPEDTIRHVTDPRTGMPSRPRVDRTGRSYTGLPDVGDVRLACEDHYRPTRLAMDREAAERRQLAERKRLMPPEGPKKTYAELVADCRARGLMIGGPKTTKPSRPVDEWLAEVGMTREQFDAIPDAK